MGEEAMRYSKQYFSFDVMGDIYKQRYQFIADNGVL